MTGCRRYSGEARKARVFARLGGIGLLLAGGLLIVPPAFQTQGVNGERQTVWTGSLVTPAYADDDEHEHDEKKKSKSSTSTPSPSSVKTVTSLPKLDDDKGESSSSSSESSSSSSSFDSGHDDDGGSRLSVAREGRSRNSGRRHDGKDEDSGGFRPPKTVEEMLKRIFSSGDSAPEHAHAAHKTAPAAGSKHRPRMPGAAPPIGGRVYSPGDVLAVNMSPAGAAHARKLGFTVGPSTHMSNMGGNLRRLQPPHGMDAAAARGLLKKDLPGGQFALNRIYSLYQPANQPAAVRDMATQAQRTEPAHPANAAMCRGDHCFGRQMIKWQDNLPACAGKVRIGVIDTSVDHGHPTFAHARLNVGNFIPEDRIPSPSWHGTGVVALLAGGAESGTPGLIPHADFYVANVFFGDGAGQVATDTTSLLRALEWMNALDVQIINMSFSGPKDELVQKSIERMAARGVVFVAAGGNDGPTAAPSYPAAYKPVIAVTAVSKELRNYPYANRGAQIDVAAPGVNIWTAVPGAREGYHSGTSFAAPYVTAVLATLIRDSPGLPKEQLLRHLSIVDLGPPGRDPIYGRGLLTAPETCYRPDGAIATAPSKPGILPHSRRPAQAAIPAQAASFR